MSTNYEQFGKYLLLEKIAAGGMAEVYLSKSVAANGLNKFFAIKRILPQFSTNEDFVAMFKEEANVAINLNHSNVVSIFDFGIEKNQFYLVMDYVEGKNLRQIINELKKTNKSFTIDQALFIVKEVAAGLDHAHRCTDSKSGRPLNITHRDMSPQNIMVSFEGEVKVIDFGIAKAETEQEETKAGTLKGKFGYMSPEQAEGLSIDPRTDVFALGIVLWELLANDRLFTGSNEAAILRKVRDCQIPSIRKVNPTVPPELERIVMKALAKDRNVRYQTAANFHRDLNRFLNTQFPDFSSQDFSQFVKENFKASVTEGREKLVHFSQAENSSSDETITAPQAQLNKNKDSLPPTPKAQNAVAESNPLPGFQPDKQVKINLDGLMSANVGNISKPNAAPASANQSKANFNPNKTSITNIHQTRVTQSSQYKKPAGFGDFMELGIKGLFVVALIYGGYWGFKNYYTNNNITRSLAQTQNQKKVKETEVRGQIDMAATAAVKISISSSPPDAQIYLDGRDTGYKTPAIISVTANKESVFVFRKEGYLEYQTSQKFAETGQLAATLQTAAQAAYLNIYLSNGGPNTKITVNGKELSEKIPVIKYPVIAQSDAIVTAYNPITKLSDEVRVKVKAGESRNVELILGRSQTGAVKK
ncbi:MAG: serine/threonine protein kinase [Bdellovibrio sp.]|nr:serine/threonine protein kinase [Bdellovibrio sp.]